MHRVFLLIPLLLLFFCTCSGQSVFGEVGESSRVDVNAVRERVVFLRSEIARHDDLYYRQASPEISDQEYDALRRELEALEAEHPQLGRTVWEIGDDRSGVFDTHPHGRPMLSLEKAYSWEEVEGFYDSVTEVEEGVEFLVEPKIDGMAVSLIYESGNFTRAVTRGNGFEGDDITENVLKISSIPHSLFAKDSETVPKRIEIRGEIFVTYADFDEANRTRFQEGEPAFRHPRNYAAGSVRLSDATEFESRDLSVVIYGYGEISPDFKKPTTLQGFYQQAKSWGFPVVDASQSKGDFDSLRQEVSRQWDGRESLGYPTDGLVVKVSQVDIQDLLGESRTAPKWAIAFKGSDEFTRTQVSKIAIQISANGRLVPVAMLEPVELAGSMINRATLNNAAWVSELGIREGDLVRLERAGGVIPAIRSIVLEARSSESSPYTFPELCPACGRSVVAEGRDLFCVNRQCPEKVKARIERFASSQAVDIRGLGPATIEKWVDIGILTCVSDLYRVDPSMLSNKEGRLAVSEKRILSEIESSKNAELWRILYGLGIPGMGKVRAQEIAGVFGSLEALLVITESDFTEGGVAYSLGLGESFREDFLNYLRDTANRQELEELIGFGLGTGG